MTTDVLISKIKETLKSAPSAKSPNKKTKKDQSFTWTLLAKILDVEPVDNLSDLKELCFQELEEQDNSLVADKEKLEYAIWLLLSPQRREPFLAWLKVENNGKPLSGSKAAYARCIEFLSYFYKENFFSDQLTFPQWDTLDLYKKTKEAQKNGDALLYSDKQSYQKYYYSSAVGSYGGYLKSPSTAGSTSGAMSTGTSSASDPSSHPSTESFHNLILYGPPGTGKTYYSIRYALSIIEGYEVSDISTGNPYLNNEKSEEEVKEAFDSYVDDNRIQFITFHQSLSYEDFIEGIKPKIDKVTGQVIYDYEDGIFKKVCDDARKTDDRYVLIIDEINRGNVAQIFGELITLLEEDKREGSKNELSCILPYSKKPFSVPNNLYIIGTMNTADRSVEALDTALRRRFCFIEMLPDTQLVPKDWRPYFEIINKRIEILRDSEHQIGHSYFIGVKDKAGLRRVFRNNIIPLLQEYFYGDTERIRMVIGNGFFEEDKSIEGYFPKHQRDVDLPSSIWKIWGKDDWKQCETDASKFENALKILLRNSESEPEDNQS